MNRRLFFQLAAGTAAVTTTIDRLAAAGRSVKDHTPEKVAADEDF
jgi:hypothetical protein